MGIDVTIKRLQEFESAAKGVYLSLPCAEPEIERVRAWLSSAVALSLPADYEHLLRVCNGLQLENDIVYSADDFYWENRDLYENPKYRKYVLLGSEGNIACWAYDALGHQFVISTAGVPDEILESYTSFSELLEARLAVYFPHSVSLGDV